MDFITDISKTKREYNVTINDEKTIRLDRKVINGLSLMDEVDIDKLIQESYDSLYESALNMSLNYLSYAIRCEAEIVKYLEKKHFPDIVINDVLNRLLELRYVSDEEYARSYIHSKAFSLNGSNRIKSELIRKGIDEKIVLDILEEEYPISEERDNLITFLKKQNEKYKNIFLREKKDKIINASMRKGYDYKLINSLIDEYVNESENLEQNEKLRQKIRKRFYRYLDKGEDIKIVKRKVYSFFFQKGYSEEILNDVYIEILDEMNEE